MSEKKVVRNKGLVIFGIILLAIGLFASFYTVVNHVGQAPAAVKLQTVYPYQSVGIILLVGGIIFTALGFLYSPRKTLALVSNPQQPIS